MINSENGSHAKYFRRVVKLISIACLAVFITTASYLNQIIESYGQQTGSIALTVVHTDGSPVKPEDFLPGSWSDTNGYYSLYDNDDNFVGTFPTCNITSQEPCETVGIAPGSYNAIISLDFGPESSSEGGIEYSESVSVEEGSLTNATIFIDIGYVKASITDDEDNELDPAEFVAWYSRLEGYYTIYDAEGNFVVDAESCNLASECIMPLRSGIFQAIVSNPSDPRKQITAFEVVESSISSLQITLTNGDPSGGAGSNNGGNDSDDGGNDSDDDGQAGGADSVNDTSSSSNAKPQREPIRLLNHTSYVDPESGSYHVVGEIQNLGTNPVHDIVIHGIFHKGEEVVAVKQGFSLLNVLAPSAKSPFEIEIKSTGISLSITNYTLTAPTAERTTEVKQQNLGLNITRQYYDIDTGLYHLEGIVVNYGNAVANFVRVIATAYDQQNRPIFVTSKYTDSHLDSGIPSTFEIVFAPNYEMQIASVTAIVESDEYSMVSAGFLKSPITLTLDSTTYDNGMFVEIGGTVGSFLTTEPFAVVEILWPDGIQEDSEMVRVSTDGSYSVRMQFFSQPEYLGETFTVRVSYGIHFTDEHFVFTKSCVQSDLWGMVVDSALDGALDRAQIEQCISSLELDVHDSRIVTPATPLLIEATNNTGARVEFLVTLATNGTSGFGQPLCVPRSGTVFPVGNTTVSCISSDRQGILAVATFIVIVQDNSVPLIVPPPSVESDGSVHVAENTEAIQSHYETNYSSQAPDASNPLIFQPEYRLYRPAENVIIFGLVHESILSTLTNSIASVTFKLLDENGSQVGGPVPVTIDPITGEFSSAGISLPSDLSPGMYKLQSELKVDLEKARTLMQNDSELQELESLGGLSNFQELIVGGSDTYLVNEEGQQYKVHIASNAHLCCNRYNNDERMMAFESIIANSTSVNTVAEVAVPKVLLDGQIRVFIDGHAAPADSVVIKKTNEARNSSMTILEVNYGPGPHTVEIYGTNVVPEFPLISYLLPALAIIGIISGTLLRRIGLLDG